MEWLTGNVFFIIILLACIAMHLFMHGGHGGHGGHGSDDKAPRNGTGRT